MFTSDAALRITPLAVIVVAAVLIAQVPSKNAPVPAIEMPVVMRQDVVAGKTPVGTTVEVKLQAATLVHGKVIPQDAILSGEVILSAEKSSAEPSRLAVRIDSAQWKDGSKPVSLTLPFKLYLASWYYPVEPPPPQDESPYISSLRSRGRRRGAPASDPNVSGPPYSRSNPREAKVPEPSASTIAFSRRMPLKNVEATRGPEGAITLTCARSNLKLNKSTAYMLATVTALASGP